MKKEELKKYKEKLERIYNTRIDENGEMEINWNTIREMDKKESLEIYIISLIGLALTVLSLKSSAGVIFIIFAIPAVYYGKKYRDLRGE